MITYINRNIGHGTNTGHELAPPGAQPPTRRPSAAQQPSIGRLDGREQSGATDSTEGQSPIVATRQSKASTAGSSQERVENEDEIVTEEGDGGIVEDGSDQPAGPATVRQRRAFGQEIWNRGMTWFGFRIRINIPSITL